MRRGLFPSAGVLLFFLAQFPPPQENEERRKRVQSHIVYLLRSIKITCNSLSLNKTKCVVKSAEGNGAIQRGGLAHRASAAEAAVTPRENGGENH